MSPPLMMSICPPWSSTATEGVEAINSSTLATSTWDSNGFVRWPFAPAASALFLSKGSNVPVSRRIGIPEVAGLRFSCSHTS